MKWFSDSLWVAFYILSYAHRSRHAEPVIPDGDGPPPLGAWKEIGNELSAQENVELIVNYEGSGHSGVIVIEKLCRSREAIPSQSQPTPRRYKVWGVWWRVGAMGFG